MKLPLRIRHSHDWPLTVLFLAAAFSVPAHGLQANHSSNPDLKHDYDAAQQAESHGDMPQAAAYSKLFIGHALNLLAQNFANVGDYNEAASLFDEGLLLGPGNVQMRLDYVQAAIAAVHSEASNAAATDWPQIVALYSVLAQAEPSPVVELNHAVAVGMAFGPEAALPLVAALEASGQLAGYHLLPATRADLLRRLGRSLEAAVAYREALELASTDAERRFLSRRLAETSI